jgi:hypothetical protein
MQPAPKGASERLGLRWRGGHAHDRLFAFINNQLLPALHALDTDPKTGLPTPSATRKQRIIGRTMTAVEKVRRRPP